MSGAVVTGAASGIGRASAEALIADGRRVALWDIAPEVTAVADGLGMPSAVVDVCDDGVPCRPRSTLPIKPWEGSTSWSTRRVG